MDEQKKNNELHVTLHINSSTKAKLDSYMSIEKIGINQLLEELIENLITSISDEDVFIGENDDELLFY